jgi:hypothetical protein
MKKCLLILIIISLYGCITLTKEEPEQLPPYTENIKLGE